MTDTFDQKTRSAIMRKVPSKGSKPEMRVRRALHAAGFRFRLHRADLPGKPDLTLVRFNTVVFVHGCFWHGHDCPRFRLPEQNRDYWEAKITRNCRRDQERQRHLRDLGWRVRIVWECRLERDIAALTAELSVWRASQTKKTPNND